LSAIGMGICLLGCGLERSGKRSSVGSSGGSAPALKTYQQSGVLDAIRYVRPDLHDGYIVGNGRMYAVAGLGRTMARVGKSQLTPEKAPLSKISWIIGPTYTIGNLGYGWQVEAAVDGRPIHWQKEAVIEPTWQSPFWGVRSDHDELKCVLHDVMVPDSAVMMRCIQIQRPDGLSPARITVTLPVHPDPRNGIFTMFDGRPVDAEQIQNWSRYVGPHIKDRPSVPKEKLQQVLETAKAIVHRAPARALYQEMSITVPCDSEYEAMFLPRALATTIASPQEQVSVSVAPGKMEAVLGILAPGQTVTLGVWIVAVTGPEAALEDEALRRLAEWKSKDLDAVMAASARDLPTPLIERFDGEHFMLKAIETPVRVVLASQALPGGVFAQSFMYPMCYVRDQYGPFRLMLAMGDYDRAYRILTFYAAMQNKLGIQNAYDIPPEAIAADNWNPDLDYGRLDGRWQRAEVPSYVILFARDYYRATGRLEQIAPLYPRLAYNLRVQHLSRNHLLPYASDESYSNFADTKPRYEQEMTDSTLLYLAACDFMIDLARLTGRNEDVEEFSELAKRSGRALMERLWLSEEGHYAYARDDRDDSESIDRRPVFDPLLRDFWIERRDPFDPKSIGCLNAVVKHLLDPLRVTTTTKLAAGMEPGYLLYAMSRCQHPQTHQAAELLQQYASGVGAFNEYYFYNRDEIWPNDGVFRPWESSVAATALIQYLLGLRADIPNAKITLQPHLPPDWKGWQTRRVPLPGHGEIQMKLGRTDQNGFFFELVRTGGTAPLSVDLELGLFGEQLESHSHSLLSVSGRPDLLRAQVALHPSRDKAEPQTLVFRWKSI
jgi:hypothetical protein